MTPIQKVAGVGQALAALLAAKGISTAEQLAKTSPETLHSIPRLGAQRASKLLAAAQKLVAGPEREATLTAPVTPMASTGAASAIHDKDPALQVKSDKKAGTKAISAKKAAKLEKDAKKAAKVEKVSAEKTAKKVSAKAAKTALEKKAKADKAASKKIAKAAKAEAEKAPKAKPDKTSKSKKKKQLKKQSKKK